MPNQTESYKAVIDVLMHPNFSLAQAREIVIAIAKSNPQIIVDAVNGPKVGYRSPTEAVVVEGIMHKGWNKIQAIKNHRALTDFGLKESKDAVEEMIERYQLKAFPNSP